MLVGCLTSQQHASVSQGRICSDSFTCCHTEIEVADQTFHLTQSQYTDTSGEGKLTKMVTTATTTTTTMTTTTTSQRRRLRRRRRRNRTATTTKSTTTLLITSNYIQQRKEKKRIRTIKAATITRGIRSKGRGR